MMSSGTVSQNAVVCICISGKPHVAVTRVLVRVELDLLVADDLLDDGHLAPAGRPANSISAVPNSSMTLTVT